MGKIERPAACPAKVPLGTRPLGIWGSLKKGRRNVLELIPEIATRAPILSGTTGKRWHMIMDPDALRHVLRDRVEDYPKSMVTKLILEPAIGNSLFVAEGAEWLWQRRTAAPVFSHRNIAALGPVMTLAAERSAARFAARAGRAVNAFEEMVTATFEVISDVTFSGSGDGFDRAAVHKAIEDYIGQTARLSVLDIIGAPRWVPRPGRMFSGHAMRQMKRMADVSIDQRRTAPRKDIPDLLDLLLAGEDPKSGRKMTVGELRDNLLTFIVAGHETTALTLSWALYLCAFDPAVQTQARAEARSVLGSTHPEGSPPPMAPATTAAHRPGRTSPPAPASSPAGFLPHGIATGGTGATPRAATTADIASLPLIRRIVDETLRLYPPAAFLSRTAQKADTLCGREVRPGDTVILPIYALHRHHALWPDPDRFDPARFADPKAIDRFAYLPFGDGPRICIGASFALQEAVIILATLLSRFQFTLVEGKPPRPVMILTLRPEGGVWLRAEVV